MVISLVGSCLFPVLAMERIWSYLSVQESRDLFLARSLASSLSRINLEFGKDWEIKNEIFNVVFSLSLVSLLSAVFVYSVVW